MAQTRAKPTPRRRLNVEARREQLVDVAKGFFAKQAYDQVKVDDIAVAAGVSEGLVYHYFPTKRDLYVGVIRVASDDLSRAVQPDPSIPPLERLSAGVDAYLEYVETHTEGYRTVHQGGVGSDPEVRAIIKRNSDREVNRLIEAIAVGAEPPDALRLAVRGWFGFMQAACLDWIETRSVPREEMRDLIVQVLIAAALTAWPQEARPQEARIDVPGGSS